MCKDGATEYKALSSRGSLVVNTSTDAGRAICGPARASPVLLLPFDCLLSSPCQGWRYGRAAFTESDGFLGILSGLYRSANYVGPTVESW